MITEWPWTANALVRYRPPALLLRRVIPVARPNDQFFVAFHAHLHLVEQAVGHQRLGAVEDGVLVAHLFGDDLERLGRKKHSTVTPARWRGRGSKALRWWTRSEERRVGKECR